MKHTPTLYQTKFYGIEIQHDEHGYYMFSSNGDEQSFNEFPTDQEIEDFAEECRYYNH